MILKKLLLCLAIVGLTTQNLYSQHSITPAKAPKSGIPVDSWEVNVRQMPPEIRAEITETMDRLKGDDEDRSIISDVGQAVGLGLVSGMVDVVVSA